MAHDILGTIPFLHKQDEDLAVGTRPIDEMNIGRMVGSFEMEPENYMGLDAKVFADYEDEAPWRGGSDYHKIRSSIFRRNISEGYSRDESIFNERTHDMFIDSIKRIVCNHIILHWGVEGYERVVLKAPNEGHASDVLLRATPRSRAIHLVRDGRDVIRSRFSPFASKILAETQDLRLRRNAVSYYAHQWNWHTNMVRKACADHDQGRILTIRYEDLRKRDIGSFRDVMKFVGYDADDEKVQEIVERSALESFADHQKGPDLPRQGGHVGGYRRVFDSFEKTMMTAIMIDNLNFYGYETKVDPGESGLSGLAQYENNTQTLKFEGLQLLSSEGFFEDGWLAKNSSFILHAISDIKRISMEIYLPKKLEEFYKEVDLQFKIGSEMFSRKIVEDGVSRFEFDIVIAKHEIFKITIKSSKSYKPSIIDSSDDERDISVILATVAA